VVVEYAEIITEKFQPPPLDSLATALRVPEFAAAPPKRGRVEKRTMLYSEWLRINGEPAEADPMPVMAE
jgi:hypothetical protein